MHWLLLAAV
jgi:hypothetical protein